MSKDNFLKHWLPDGLNFIVYNQIHTNMVTGVSSYWEMLAGFWIGRRCYTHSDELIFLKRWIYVDPTSIHSYLQRALMWKTTGWVKDHSNINLVHICSEPNPWALLKCFMLKIIHHKVKMKRLKSLLFSKETDHYHNFLITTFVLGPLDVAQGTEALPAVITPGELGEPHVTSGLEPGRAVGKASTLPTVLSPAQSLAYFSRVQFRVLVS